jgi:signal transduction histidine kinase
MLRGFRHTVFLILQVGVVISGALAVAIEPAAWLAILVCVTGALIAALICDRIARRYLRHTLGRLRHVADEIGHGRLATIEVRPGDDLYKLVAAINLVAHRLAAARDEERRLQAELHQKERLAFLGELAASVAHEINNPLDGVQNCARILRRTQDPQRSRQMLDLIDSGLARMDLIVRRLLALAREHVIRPEEVRVSAVLDAALEAVRDQIKNRGIRIRREPDSGDDRACVDRPLLEQVFVNLMLNGADSMPSGGDLMLRITREEPAAAGGNWAGGVIRVDVADTGVGISPDILAHIFEPFFTTKSSGRGTGLGLPIAARIVDAHQGSIAVAPGAGGGTVFTVRIPAAPVALPDAASANQELSAAAEPV